MTPPACMGLSEGIHLWGGTQLGALGGLSIGARTLLYCSRLGAAWHEASGRVGKCVAPGGLEPLGAPWEGRALALPGLQWHLR